MAKKRKHDSKSSEPTEPPQKQLQQEPEPAAEEPENEQERVEEVEYEELEKEEEEEEEGDDEEEVEEEEEEEEEDNAEDGQKMENASGMDDDEPLEKLLEPFSKDQLVNLLREAAEKHADVASRVRGVADEDPAHRKIFVHGLGWDTKAEALVEVFKQYGEIEDCKAVFDKASGKSKGYGFVLFKTRRGASKALKNPQNKIGNRMTACQLASVGPVLTPAASTTQHHQQQQPPVSEYTQRKIFVSNVAAELNAEKLLEFFSKYGEIEEGPLGLDKITGKPKGFCLFVYKTVEAAKKALEEPHKNFEGHVLHCQKAIDGPKPKKSQPQHHHNGQNSHFQRNDNAGFVGGGAPVAGHGHLMAPSGHGVGGPAPQALNPALGQALTALLTQGAGLGINPALGQALLGTLGSGAGAGAGMQPAYANPANVSPGVIGGYGTQGGYPNQPMAQGGSGRGQHGVSQYGGAPYTGH